MSTSSTVNFRLEPSLQKKATLKAKRLGIPLSLVLRNAVKEFIANDNFIVFGEPETLEDIPTDVQEKLDHAMEIAKSKLDEKIKKVA